MRPHDDLHNWIGALLAGAKNDRNTTWQRCSQVHSGKSKSCSSKSKSSDSGIHVHVHRSQVQVHRLQVQVLVHWSHSHSTCHLRKGKTYLPYITWPPPQRNVCLNTFYKCLWSHSLQSIQQIKHLAAWLFYVNNNFISVSGWLHVHVISITFVSSPSLKSGGVKSKSIGRKS